MDLASLKIADTIEFEIILPDGSGSGVFFEIYGQDSETYKAAERLRINKKLKSKSQRGAERTVEDIERDNFETLMSAMKSVRGAELDGRELGTSTEDMQIIFEYMPYAKEQLDRKIVDRVLFMKR